MGDETTWKNGVFQIHGDEIWGQIRLAGPDTLLNLRTEKGLTEMPAPDVIHGRLHDFTLVSCLNCIGGETPAHAWNGNGENATSWQIFPHEVLIGTAHFDPAKDRIRKVWFATPDIYQIFDDYDSFGFLPGSPELKQSLLPKTIGERQIPIGPNPILVYFAGTKTVLDAELDFGSFKVQYWTLPESSSRGAGIRTQMRVQVEFKEAVDLDECLAKVASIGQFLSLVAGRSQGIENVHVSVEGADSKALPLALYWSLSPRHVDGQEIDTPNALDMPLDSIRRKDEFKHVLQRWFATDEHKDARARLHSCRESGNRFTVDRLVAAANLFDLTVTALPTIVPPDLAQAKEQCLKILRAAPKSDERTSAIQAINRIGTPTLRTKTLARANLLRGHFILDSLDEVIRQAVKCRNYFVHGPGDTSFNYAAVAPFMPFLTETLEFIVAAAELIECGWEAATWRRRLHTGHHWMIRFLHDYDDRSKALLSAVETARQKVNDSDD